jgi:transcriptional regulator GlxA family with amidase domain
MRAAPLEREIAISTRPLTGRRPESVIWHAGSIGTPGRSRVRPARADLSLPPSLQRAMDHILSDPSGDCSDAALARTAGITIASLRRNFREHVGAPIARFVQNARLDWAKERLGHANETRSVQQLGIDLGFMALGGMTRAYKLRFGETPSETRAKAFGQI